MQDERHFNKFVRSDWRKQLNPSLDVVKPRPRQAAIQPEHIMTDYEIDKLYQEIVRPGPSTFKPEHKLTEKRADVGIVKFQEPVKEEEEEIDERIGLFPSVAAILPNHMTFKYYEPSKGLGPQHTPEKIKHPENWKFYQIDLDAVREQVATNVYLGGAKNLTQEEFQEKEEFLDVLHAYLDRKNNKKPEPGTYNARLPEKHLPDIDFDKV